MTEKQYKRSRYLQEKLHEVKLELREFRGNDDSEVSIGYTYRDNGNTYENIRVSKGDEFIYNELLKLLERYQEYLKQEFEKL